MNAFAVLSVLFFAPLEIYLGNINEFNFPFNHIWWLLLAGCVILVAVGTAVECLFPDKLFLASNAAVFALALCCYAQAMFLNGKMGTLTGENKVYGTGVIVTNLLIWFLILAAIAVLAVILVKKQIHHGADLFFSGAGGYADGRVRFAAAFHGHVVFQEKRLFDQRWGI